MKKTVVEFMGQRYKYDKEELARHASRGRRPYGHVDKNTNCTCSLVCAAATIAKQVKAS